MTTTNYFGKAVASFLLVLLTMPLGHALMILMEHLMSPTVLHYSAFAMGLIGLLLAIDGVFMKGDLRQTLAGLFGGLLFWTGWVEFLFQYYADRLGMQPVPDPVTGKLTQPEYLILPASFGFLVMFFVLYLFSLPSGCNFFNWIRRHTGIARSRETVAMRPAARNSSLVTFMELNLILWTSYLLLMFCYDPVFLGSRHTVTILLAVGCLVGSAFIFLKQTRIASWGANIRMAIATVIVFWSAVEIAGRNGVLTEIWVAPLEHLPEMIVIAVLFLSLGALIIRKSLQRG